jgi:hypothetical protein
MSEKNLPDGAAFVVVRMSDVHKYVIYANGKTEGFPDGCVIVNGIAPVLHQAAGIMHKHCVPREIIDKFLADSIQPL